jgi:hypothetical protein
MPRPVKPKKTAKVEVLTDEPQTLARVSVPTVRIKVHDEGV